MAKMSRKIGSPHFPTISADVALRRLRKLLEQVSEIRSARYDSDALSTWQGNLKIVLAEFYGEDSIAFKEFNGIWFSPGVYYPGQPEHEFIASFNSGLNQAEGFLKSRIEDLQDRLGQEKTGSPAPLLTAGVESRKVFVVHGHDYGNKETVARFLGNLELEPVILHEQPDKGRTIIEKFEAHAADAQCAVVILTADDIATSKANSEGKELRARQNVILELGFFVGRLGRDRTFALVEKGVTLPSDVDGIIYIPLDDPSWRFRLVKELKAVGLEVDANRAI